MEIKQSRDLGDTIRTHIHGSGKFENKYGVGILMNKKRRKRIYWTDCNNERVDVYFRHSGYADHHVERVYSAMEKTRNPKRRASKYWEETSTLNWGPVLHWLMLQNFVALNTMYRKTPEKQVTRTPKGVENQLDCILVDRKHMCCSRDVGANDMIHMGSDHRSVTAQFVITASKKEVSQKNEHRKEENPNSRENKKSRR